MSKLQKVDKWCPNLITNNEHYAIGEIKTWDEFNTSPINEVWRLKENDFKELQENNYHYFTVIQKKRHDSSHIILIKTNSLGVILEVRNLNNTLLVEGWLYDKTLNPYQTIIAAHISGEPMFEFNAEKKQKQNTDINKEAYDVSSQLFSFKDLRRGVVEHGKTCYIEGYKKHAELFETFLVKNGYFSEEELHRVQAEFESSLTNKPVISIRYVEDTMRKLFPKTCDSYLFDSQKDIIDEYTKLDGGDNNNTLSIIKPRQKGVSTALETIAYLEAKNGKKVLYCGFGSMPKCFSDSKLNNITYRNLGASGGNAISEYSLCGHRFDLIIVDEITHYENPELVQRQLSNYLSDNARLIFVGTPPRCCVDKRYKNAKEFFNIENEACGTLLSIPCSEEDFDKAVKYPELKNEILGRFAD